MTFFDVEFSTDTDVGEEMTLTGKVKVLEAWPEDNLGVPDVGQIGVTVAGPQLVLIDRKVNGQFAPGSIRIERGGVYEFEMTLVGRRPGEWHVHPMLAVAGSGSLVGPGQYVTVEGTGVAFTNPVTLANGETVDLETVGLSRVITWAVIVFLIGAAWLVYWLGPKPLLSRAAWVGTPAEANLITATDGRVANFFVVIVVLVLAGGFFFTQRAYPVTIPRQVHRFIPPPFELPESFVEAEALTAAYDPATAKMTIDVEFSNIGTTPISVTQFSTAYLTFAVDPGEGEHLLTVDSSDPLAPGETTTATITMEDVVWEEEALMSLREAQLIIAGLLFFEDDDGA